MKYKLHKWTRCWSCIILEKYPATTINKSRFKVKCNCWNVYEVWYHKLIKPWTVWCKVCKDNNSYVKLAKKHNIKYNVFMGRLRRWWPIDKIISTPINWIKEPICYEWEERREIKWYEWYYEVSDLWRIRTYWKSKKWYCELQSEPVRILKWWKKKQTTTYNCITLYSEHTRKYHYKIARLVAQAFLWLDYNDKYTLVCHKDDDGMNNKLSNLFLWTHKDNTQDSINKWRFFTNKINSWKTN